MAADGAIRSPAWFTLPVCTPAIDVTRTFAANCPIVNLGQKGDAGVKHATVDDGVARVAGGKQRAQTGMPDPCLVRQLPTGHPGHDDVGEEQGDARLRLSISSASAPPEACRTV